MYKIADKTFEKLLRLPKTVMFLILALSFIYGAMFGSMQLASLTARLFGISINIYAAVFIFGVINWLLFELIAAAYFWVVKYVMNTVEIQKNKTAMTAVLRWFFVAENIILGSLRLCYFNYPLSIMLMENVLIFAVGLAVLILYYFYIRKKYIPPQLYPRSVAAFCVPYLLFLAVNMLTSFIL